MSSALVRQALELVDQEDSAGTKRGVRGKRPRHTGQDQRHPYKSRNKKPKQPVKSKEEIIEDNIRKLTALSKPAPDTTVADKIVERAISRKPLADKIELKHDEQKSILFPEEEKFVDFEKELFCS